MGLGIFLIAFLVVIIGLLFMPTVTTFVDGLSWTGDWGSSPLEAIVGLLPLAALVLIVITVAWIFRRA